MTANQLTRYASLDAWAADLTATARNLHADVWRLAELLDGGEAQFGEAIYQYTDSLGLDYGYLRNLKWVAGVFPLSRRVTLPALPLSYFQEVAPLPDDEADGWLILANEKGWSRADLRAKLREARRRTDRDPNDVEIENHALSAELHNANGRIATLEAQLAQRVEASLNGNQHPADVAYAISEHSEWLTGRAVCPRCGALMRCPECE